jgi:hypothetical protein
LTGIGPGTRISGLSEILDIVNILAGSPAGFRVNK